MIFNLKNTIMDLSNMFGKLKDVQAKMKEAQDNLVNITAEGESGGGMVKTIVNGKRQIVSLDVDDSLLNKEDKQMMQDLIIAAVNKAMDEIDIKTKDELKKSTEGFIPNIPGLDLGL